MNDATQTEQPAQKFFYFLVAGNILFSFTGDSGDLEVSTITQSCIVRNDRREFPVKSLVRAQRNLQAIFYQKTGKEVPGLAIRDVVLTSTSLLGEMTEDEFQELPEELAQQMQSEPANDGPTVLRSVDDLKAAVNIDGTKIQ